MCIRDRIDEVQECRVLFEKLNESLRSGWQQYYEAAKAYAQKHGNLLVPRRFKTEDGLALGEWLSTCLLYTSRCV